MSESNSSPAAPETNPEVRVFMKPPRTPEALLDAVLKLSRRLTGREPTDAEIEDARAVIVKRFAERDRLLSEASADNVKDTPGHGKITGSSERKSGEPPSED